MFVGSLHDYYITIYWKTPVLSCIESRISFFNWFQLMVFLKGLKTFSWVAKSNGAQWGSMGFASGFKRASKSFNHCQWKLHMETLIYNVCWQFTRLYVTIYWKTQVLNCIESRILFFQLVSADGFLEGVKDIFLGCQVKSGF